jgi:hypothetical protein
MHYKRMRLFEANNICAISQINTEAPTIIEQESHQRHIAYAAGVAEDQTTCPFQTHGVSLGETEHVTACQKRLHDSKVARCPDSP